MKLAKALWSILLVALGNGIVAQNVGIGTAAPLDKLHVVGNVRVSALAGAGTRVVGADINGTLTIVAPGANGQVLTQTAGGPNFQTPSADWAVLGNAGTASATNFIGTTDAVDLVTRTNSAERMRVTAGGLVGINTSGPISRLHVAGDIRVGEVVGVGVGVQPSFGDRLYFSGSGGSVAFNSDNSDPIWMARYNVAQDQTELRLNLSDNCQTADAFVIQTGGSGCAVTDYFRFDGAGNAYKAGGGAWTAFSDRRLKRDVQAFTDGLNVVNAVRPVNFQYNGLAGTTNNGQIYTGVVAQELQAIAPYMVGQQGEYLTVDPSAFTYILLNAVKEQQAQIDAMKQEIETLKHR